MKRKTRRKGEEGKRRKGEREEGRKKERSKEGEKGFKVWVGWTARGGRE